MEPGTHRITSSELTSNKAAAVCIGYEEASNIDSAEFYARYRQGEFCSDRVNGFEATRWAIYYQAYLNLRPAGDSASEWTSPANPAGDLVSA